MFFRKHTLPDDVLNPDEVCIGWVHCEWWSAQGWETKRFCYARMMPAPCEGYDDELCAAIVVKRSTMLERGYMETERGFIQKFSWEDQHV